MTVAAHTSVITHNIERNCPVNACTDTNELIRHAIAAWSYLVPWNSRLTLAEFAAMIRRHSTHERA